MYIYLSQALPPPHTNSLAAVAHVHAPRLDLLLNRMLLVTDTLLPDSDGLDICQRALAMIATDLPDLLEADGGDEADALPRLGNLGIELIDLFEGEALGLVDHGPDEEEADEAEAAPDEEDLGAEVRVTRAVVDHVRGRVGDGPVEEPVGRGGHGEGLGADLQGEDLTRDDLFSVS